MPNRPAIGLKARSRSGLLVARSCSRNSVRMKKMPPPCSVECWLEWMMFAPRSNRKCETAATIPGRSGHEIRRRPTSSFTLAMRCGGGSYGGFQAIGVVGAFPGDVQVRAAEVAVGGSLFEDGAAQVQGFDDAARAKVEGFGDGALDLFGGHRLGAERLDGHTHRP